MSKLSIKLETVALSDILEAEINPQQMKDAAFQRLVKSIKRDGTLSSTPLLNRRDGKLYCISGHHRIKAALKAGLKSAVAMIANDLDASTATRLQLQHNDIHGEPDAELARILQMRLEEVDLALVDAFPDLVTPAPPERFDVEETYTSITFALAPRTAEMFARLVADLSDPDGNAYLLGDAEYAALQSWFTRAYRAGIKAPGRAIERMVEIASADLAEMPAEQHHD